MKSFREHVAALPLEEQRALRAAEQRYLTARRAGVAEDPAQRDFEESFHGYSEPPAGPRYEEEVLIQFGLDKTSNL